jgi:hypothetical protein
MQDLYNIFSIMIKKFGVPKVLKCLKLRVTKVKKYGK